MPTKTVTRLLIATAALGLAGCGGGGGVGGGVSSTPPPPPPPPSPPPPTSGTTGSPIIFPAVTTSTEFSVLGSEASAMNDASLATAGFSVRYDAATKQYVVDVPVAEQPGEFRRYTSDSPNQHFWGGAIVSPSGAAVNGVRVRKPTSIALTYTTAMEYGMLYQGGAAGVAAFGTATAPGAVPVAGSASYLAVAEGITVDGNGAIDGSATLQSTSPAASSPATSIPYSSAMAGWAKAPHLAATSSSAPFTASAAQAFRASFRMGKCRTRAHSTASSLVRTLKS